jgi:hypothetical protein
VDSNAAQDTEVDDDVDGVRLRLGELWPPVGLLFIPQMIYEYGEPGWNDIDRENS